MHSLNRRNLVYVILSMLFVLFGVFGYAAKAQVGIITTYAGGGPNNFPAAQTGTGSPLTSAVDAVGNLYILSPNGVLRVDHASGELTIVAGDYNPYYYPSDGAPATSTRSYPHIRRNTMRHLHCLNYRIFLCAIFSLFGFFGVLESDVQAQVGTISTYAGGGLSNNLIATQAFVRFPSATAVDASGNV